MAVKQTIPTYTNSTKSLTLGNFKGIDASSSPFGVSASRATYCQNLINENGVNHKRQGWRAKLQFDNAKCIYEFTLNGLNRLLVIYYSNNTLKICLYEIIDDDITNINELCNEEWNFEEEEIQYIERYGYDFSKCYCYIKDNVAYLIGIGQMLIIKDNEISGTEGVIINSEKGIVHSDSYIPTTTISINRDSESAQTRAKKESVNLLSRYRKNSLIGIKNSTNSDAIQPLSNTDIDLTKTWTLDSAVSSRRSVVVKIKSLLDDITNLSSNQTTENLEYSTAETESNKNIVNNLQINEFVYLLNDNGEFLDDNGNVLIKIHFETGQIEFNVRTDPPIDGEDNIEVIFSPKDTSYFDEGHINMCKFGIQFGVEGYKDRLFLSGNPMYPNRVYYSEFGDFTYFPFTNYHDLGSNNNPIAAFSRLNDSTVAIHKKNNNIDPTIYYMTYSINENYDVQGIEKYSFPIVAGVIGESPVNNSTCFNLSNDNLFLSNNGVYGIELNENIKSNERYALERSGFISSMLSKHEDLSKATAIVYKNRYYLAIDNIVYVADARHKSSARTGDMKDTFNYEWYYWTNMPVQQWLIIKDKLWFLSKTGNLCEFYDGYEDINLKVINLGNLTITEDNKYKIAYNSAFDELFENSDKLMIEFTSHVEGECLPNIQENTVLTSKYYIVDIDCYNHTFSISTDQNGENKIKITYVASSGMLAFLYHSNVVTSIWKTPILSLGTTTYSKNLLSSTLVCEPNIEGHLQYGCRTNNKLIRSTSELRPANGLDFENFDFTNFSFEDGLARSRTIKTRIRNFNFIEFIIKSDDDKDCAINNFTITYNIGRKNKGVR